MPAIYGIPVLFGPKYQKFQEAVELIAAGGGYSIKDYEGLKALLDRFLTDRKFLQETGEQAAAYVTSRAGATDRILELINL